MRTPSLRARVVAIGVGVVLVVIMALDVLVYASLHQRLTANQNELLDDRADIVLAEASHLSPQALAARMTELGLIVTIHAPDASVYNSVPASPSLGNAVPAGPDTGGPMASKTVSLPGGGSAEIFARRTGLDMALSRLLRLEIAGTFVAVVLAGILLWYAAQLVLRPLRQIAASARRTSAGQPGQRLCPDRPETELGIVATAYDEMVANLETAVVQAREAEHRLESLHRRSQEILETANDAYVALDAAGSIVDWNRRAEEVFGWTKDEALTFATIDIGIPLEVLLGSTGHVDGIERTALTARTRDGRPFPVELSVWQTRHQSGPIYNAFVTDITERRRGEDALYRLAAIVDSAQEAIISTKPDGEVLTWNDGATALYGFTPDEAIGQPLSIIVPPELQDEVEASMAQVFAGGTTPPRETVRRCRNGNLVEVSITASPVYDPSGRVVAQSVIARDITEQRWMARALDETLASLEAALDEAQQAEARMRRFVDDAAHQLRAPIAGIRAAAETLLRTDDLAARDHLLAGMVKEVSRAGRLVAGLLRLARLDHEPSVTRAPCDVRAVCETEIARVRARSPQVEFSLAASQVRDTQVIDAAVLSEILGNLLENAARHARTRVEVVASTMRGGVEVQVSDDGPGMTDDAARRAFDRFVSLDGRGGSGLGLPIARALARTHGGDLTYVNPSFTVCLDGGPAPERVKGHEQARAS